MKPRNCVYYNVLQTLELNFNSSIEYLYIVKDVKITTKSSNLASQNSK